jgi:hypothetical protein
MITEQRIRNILESLTYKAAAGSTIAVEAIAVITELAAAKARLCPECLGHGYVEDFSESGIKTDIPCPRCQVRAAEGEGRHDG